MSYVSTSEQDRPWISWQANSVYVQYVHLEFDLHITSGRVGVLVQEYIVLYSYWHIKYFTDQ